MRLRERFILAGLLTVLLGFTGGLAGQSAAASTDSAPAVSAQQHARTALEATSTDVAKTGPEPGITIDKQQEAADTKQQANKLIVGVIAVLLLALVWYGRRKRRKYRRKLKNLQNAKV